MSEKTKSTKVVEPAIDSQIEEAKTGKIGDLEFNGETYPILRKPPTLLLSELARVGSGDPEAVGVIAEFFEVTLGKDTYKSFKRAFYAAEAEDTVLMEKLHEVLGATMGRPTK